MRPNNMSKEKQQSLLTENIVTLIPKMAVPTIIAQLITTIYNLVDTYFVSTLGTNATAAVGVNASLSRAITLIGSLIGAGACSYIARLLGAKKQDDANRVLSTSLISGVVLGVVFAIVCLMVIHPLVNILGATPECVEYSIDYASYILYASPVMVGSFILNMCLRSEGRTSLAMVGIGFGGVLNCFLDPLFIYVLDFGVAGAAMATALSQLVSFCILLSPYIRKITAVNISVRSFKLIWEDVKEVITIGSSSFFRSIFAVLATVSINRVAGGYSTATLAALSVANRVMEFPFAVILGFGQGYQPVAGFNWGAKQWKRVRESYRFAIIVSIVGGIVMGAIVAGFADPIVHIFNKQADAEVLEIGIFCIRMQCLVLVSHAVNSVVNMFYAGVGMAGKSLAVNLTRQGYCFFPALWIAPALWGVRGVASTQAIADVLSLIVVIPLGIYAYRMISKKEQEEKENGTKQAA
ncbi:MAG: MATE family efflux transporter [Dorea sp.]